MFLSWRVSHFSPKTETPTFTDIPATFICWLNLVKLVWHGLKPYSSVQFSPVQSSCSILILCKPLEARSIGFLPKKAPAYRRIFPITLVLPHQTHLGTENALFYHTKRTDQINYPCFATPNAPRNQKQK